MFVTKLSESLVDWVMSPDSAEADAKEGGSVAVSISFLFVSEFIIRVGVICRIVT